MVPFPWWAYNLNNTGARTLGSGHEPITLTPFGLASTGGKYDGCAVVDNDSSVGTAFDGFAGYIQVDCSVSAWFFVVSGGNDELRFWSKHSTYGTCNFAVIYQGGLNRQFSATGATTSSNVAFSSGWNHVAFTRASGTVKAYLNGALAATLAGTGANSSADGASSYEVGQTDNVVDELMAWNVALTAAEVADVYAAEMARITFSPAAKPNSRIYGASLIRRIA